MALVLRWGGVEEEEEEEIRIWIDAVGSYILCTSQTNITYIHMMYLEYGRICRGYSVSVNFTGGPKYGGKSGARLGGYHIYICELCATLTIGEGTQGGRFQAITTR